MFFFSSLFLLRSLLAALFSPGKQVGAIFSSLSLSTRLLMWNKKNKNAEKVEDSNGTMTENNVKGVWGAGIETDLPTPAPATPHPTPLSTYVWTGGGNIRSSSSSSTCWSTEIKNEISLWLDLYGKIQKLGTQLPGRLSSAGWLVLSFLCVPSHDVTNAL